MVEISREPGKPFTRDQWWKLPLPLRHRWWDETDFSKRPQDASPELCALIRQVLAPVPT
jgi:hypothetical protein